MSSFKIREDHLIAYADFFEEHRDFATGRLSCSNAREQFKKLWGELASVLNGLGFGTKSIDKWQRTWSDYKLNLKKRAADLKKQQTGTGGGPPINKGLSDTEIRILNILGKTFFEGCGTQEKGFESYKIKNASKENDCPATITSGSLSIGSDNQFVNTYDSLASSLASRPIPPNTQGQVKRLAPHDTYDDHDYLATNSSTFKKKQIKSDNLTNYYQDTLQILTNIDRRLERLDEKMGNLDRRLENIDNTLSNKLTDICNVLKKNRT